MSMKSTISIYKTDLPDFNKLCRKKGMKSADFIRELIKKNEDEEVKDKTKKAG